MSSPLIRAAALCKSYSSGARRIDVLLDLDLEVVAGESVAIVGQSGVGKSTLLHILGGLDRADRGSLSFQGLDLQQAAPARLAEFRNQSVGFVFQAHYLLPEFSALENVEMPFRIARQEGEWKQQAIDVLCHLGLEHRLHHWPGTLSGGEQQRVAIARALALAPALVLADEPTGNLDPQTGNRVFELLTQLQRERGFALVLVTHNEQLARRCDRVLRLEGGRLETLGDAETQAYFKGLGG